MLFIATDISHLEDNNAIHQSNSLRFRKDNSRTLLWLQRNRFGLSYMTSYGRDKYLLHSVSQQMQSLVPLIMTTAKV